MRTHSAARELVATFAARWLDARRHEVSERTREAYGNIVHRWILPTFGDRPLRAIRGPDVSRWISGLPLGPSSRQTVHAVLRTLLESAVRDELITANPAKGRAPRVPRREPPYMPPQDTRRFLEVAARRTPHLYVLFLTLARTGMRLGEGLGLQWNDLDFAARAVRVERSWSDHRVGPTKTRRGRRVDLAEDLAQVLQAWRALQPREPWCFPARDRDEPWTRGAVQEAMRRLTRELGLPPGRSPKAFRHGFASTLIALGEPIAFVQRQLGHATIGLTVDLYGSHEPMQRPGAVNRLAEIGRGG